MALACLQTLPKVDTHIVQTCTIHTSFTLALLDVDLKGGGK